MWFAHGEPNAFPVPTCNRVCPGKPDKYFRDGNFNMHKQQIDSYISRIPTDKPIILFPKIGEGCSKMKDVSPQLFSYLRNCLDKIKHPNIKIDYNDQY